MRLPRAGTKEALWSHAGDRMCPPASAPPPIVCLPECRQEFVHLPAASLLAPLTLSSSGSALASLLSCPSLLGSGHGDATGSRPAPFWGWWGQEAGSGGLQAGKNTSSSEGLCPDRAWQLPLLWSERGKELCLRASSLLGQAGGLPALPDHIEVAQKRAPRVGGRR